MRFSTLAAVVVGAGAFLACGGGDNGGGGPNPSPNVIAKTSSNSGDAQTGVVGQALTNSFCVIIIKDAAAQAGVNVGWSTSSGGTMSSPTVATGADGVACSKLTLGTTSGGQTAQAALSGATGSPVAFTATASPGPAVDLQKTSGDNQTALINEALDASLVAKVVDQFGNGVAGSNVSWTVTTGIASLNPAAGPSSASGSASTVVTLGGTAGAIVITAAATSVVGNPTQTYNATAVAPTPTPTAITITLANSFYSPLVDTVAVGGTVTWNWPTALVGPHSVTSTGPTSFVSDARGEINGPTTYGPITFNTAGTYFYYCTQHGNPGNPPSAMSGTIVVQ